MPNIFDQTEKLVREFAEIREHNAAFRALYNELCSDDLLKHYSVFTGEHKAAILHELEAIEKSVNSIGKQLNGVGSSGN